MKAINMTLEKTRTASKEEPGKKRVLIFWLERNGGKRQKIMVGIWSETLF